MPACRARGDRRGDAVARRRQLPGRVPQPARRPVPPRRGGRRRARGDAGVHGAARRRPPTGRSTRRRRWRSSSPSSPVFVTYVVGASFGGSRTGVTLVLAGVAVTSLATAVQTFLLQRNVDVVREVYSWILGRLSTAQWADVRMVLPYVVVAAASCCSLHRRHLDLFRVGEDEASTLGAPVARVRLVVVDRGDARDGRGRLGQRADRLRRHRRAPPRAAASPGRATGACCRCRCCSAPRSWSSPTSPAGC